MKLTKYFVMSLLLIQIFGCWAMDIGEPSRVIVKNTSGYAIQLDVAYRDHTHRRIVIDPGQEENLDSVSDLESFKYAGYGEVWGKTSWWNEYTPDQVNILRQNQQVGIDLVLEITTKLQKFYMPEKIEFRKQRLAGTAQDPLSKRPQMRFLNWFPRVKAKLLEKHSIFVLSQMTLPEVLELIKEEQEKGAIKDYYFLRLPSDATKNEIENQYIWLRNEVLRSIPHAEPEREPVLRYLDDAKNSMLRR